MKAKVQGLLKTKIGSIINVALYQAGSAALAAGLDALIKSLSGINLAGEPANFVLTVQIINLVLVGLKQALKK